MRRVGVIGVGHGRFGVRDDASLQELAFEAYREAIEAGYRVYSYGDAMLLV